MDEKTKKLIMAGVIVVCLVAAGVITCKAHRPKGPNLKPFKDKTTWVKCRNPACGAAYQMNLKEYYEYVQKHADYRSLLPPPLICQECGEPSVYMAVKCPKCGDIFERGIVPADFADRCPNCGYSQIEWDRKKAAEVRQQTENGTD